MDDTEDVRAQCATRVEPRVVDARLAGEVDDGVGKQRRRRRRRGLGIGEIDLEQAQAGGKWADGRAARSIEADDVGPRASAREVLDEMSGDEAGGSRDENVHESGLDLHRCPPRAPWRCWAPVPMKLPCEPTLARFNEKRQVQSSKPP